MALLSLSQRKVLKDKIVREKVETLVPTLMENHGVEMWIVGGSNDPLYDALLGELPHSKTVLIFVKTENSYVKYRNHRHAPSSENVLYAPFLAKGEDLFVGIGGLIKKHSPKNIALNMSNSFDELDNASHSLYENIKAVCGETEIISAEALAMDVMQIRTKDELEIYEEAAKYARELIREVLSSKKITKGVTTTDDLHWYMLEEMDKRGLVHTWGPNVDFQRKGEANPMIGGEESSEIICEGDLVHIDFGLCYMFLHTDMQYIAYMTKEGEDSAPQSFKDGFEQARQLQEIFMETVKVGKTGNEARAEILEKAEKAGLDAMVYSHPVGHSVHAVGPSVGRFGFEGDIPSGVFEIKEDTCYAMELNVKTEIPEWDNQAVYFFREEDVRVSNDGCFPIGGLQDSLWEV